MSPSSTPTGGIGLAIAAADGILICLKIAVMVGIAIKCVTRVREVCYDRIHTQFAILSVGGRLARSGGPPGGTPRTTPKTSCGRPCDQISTDVLKALPNNPASMTSKTKLHSQTQVL